MHFSSRAEENLCQFDNIPHQIGPKGVPLLKDTSAILLCTPRESHKLGDHYAWYGEVMEALSGNDSCSEPLLYYARFAAAVYNVSICKNF